MQLKHSLLNIFYGCILFLRTSVNDLQGLPVYCFPGLLVSEWEHHTAKMDFQHRAGGKTGSGGVASTSESNRDRRERLRQLALETIDINKDPYFMKNHLGSYECKLCLTLHNNEVSKSGIKLFFFLAAVHLGYNAQMKVNYLPFTGQLLGTHTRKETSDQLVSLQWYIVLSDECSRRYYWTNLTFRYACIYFTFTYLLKALSDHQYCCCKELL